MLDILHPWYLIKPYLTKLRNHLNLPPTLQVSLHYLIFPPIHSRESKTYTLLHQLNIVRTHTQPPNSAQMPRRLVPQVLDHDPRKHYQFRIDPIEDAVVGEIETISYISSDPG